MPDVSPRVYCIIEVTEPPLAVKTDAVLPPGSARRLTSGEDDPGEAETLTRVSPSGRAVIVTAPPPGAPTRSDAMPSIT